ncbi:MAG TPA: hypothetical protein VMH22_11520 [bacterium]|nr:hypothetical protein [bacterium]
MKPIVAAVWVAACLFVGPGCKQNAPPLTPGAPTGPAVGMAGESLNFVVVTTDPESDSVRYQVDWGDALGNWTGLLASAESCTLGHAWSVLDAFKVRVRAEDAHGNVSDWSADHTVSIESICRR